MMEKSSLGKGPEGQGASDKPAVSPLDEVTRSVSIAEVSREARKRDQPQGQDGEKASGAPATPAKAVPVDGPRSLTATRPMRLTPGGGYSALLAHARPKRSTEIVPRTDGGVTPALTVTDPLEITAVGGSVSAPRMGETGGGLQPGRARTLTPGGAILAEEEFEGQEITQSEITLVGDSPGDDSSKVGSAKVRGGTAAPVPSTVSSEAKVPIPRPTRLTPGSGGLAALLAQKRDRHHQRSDANASGAQSPVVDPAGAAGASKSAATPAPPEPVAPVSEAQERKSGFASTLRPGIATPVSVPAAPSPVPSSVPAPESEAEPKKSGFSATLRPGTGATPSPVVDPPSVPESKKYGLSGTLLGVSRPELGLPGRSGDTPWVRPAPGTDSGQTDDFEWTERNSAIPGVRSGALNLANADAGGFGATPLDRLRNTAALDFVQRDRPRRWPIAVGVGTAVVVAVVAVLWPRVHQHAPEQTGMGQPVAAKPPTVVLTPAAVAPGAVVAKPLSVPAEAPAPPVAAISSANAIPTAPAAKQNLPFGGGPAAVAEAPAGGSASVEADDPPEQPSHKTSRRSARAESRPAKTKSKKKPGEARSSKTARVAAPDEPRAASPRTRAPAAASDPDATLPLTGQ